MFCFRLEVWPGFVTSILQFEKNVMLIADMSHKILNGTTVWSVMQDVFQKSGSNNQRYRDSCAKKLVGEIVLTRYNILLCYVCLNMDCGTLLALNLLDLYMFG